MDGQSMGEASPSSGSNLQEKKPQEELANGQEQGEPISALICKAPRNGKPVLVQYATIKRILIQTLMLIHYEVYGNRDINAEVGLLLEKVVKLLEAFTWVKLTEDEDVANVFFRFRDVSLVAKSLASKLELVAGSKQVLRKAVAKRSLCLDSYVIHLAALGVAKQVPDGFSPAEAAAQERMLGKVRIPFQYLISSPFINDIIIKLVLRVNPLKECDVDRTKVDLAVLCIRMSVIIHESLGKIPGIIISGNLPTPGYHVKLTLLSLHSVLEVVCGKSATVKDPAVVAVMAGLIIDQILRMRDPVRMMVCLPRRSPGQPSVADAEMERALFAKPLPESLAESMCQQYGRRVSCMRIFHRAFHLDLEIGKQDVWMSPDRFVDLDEHLTPGRKSLENTVAMDCSVDVYLGRKYGLKFPKPEVNQEKECEARGPTKELTTLTVIEEQAAKTPEEPIKESIKGTENTKAIEEVLEEATVAPKAIEEATAAPKAIEEATAAPKAIEKVFEEATEAPKAIEEATEAPKAIEEATEAPKAIDEAIEEPTAATKAIEEATAAPKAIEKVLEEATEAPKAIEEASEAPKAIEEATEAPKAIEEAIEEHTAATKAIEEAIAAPKAIDTVLEEATEAPKAIEEATEAPKAVEETTEAPKAIEEGTAAPKAIEEATEAPKAIEEAIEAPKAIEDATAAPKAIEDATEATKAIEEATEAPKAIEEPTAATKAIEEATAAPKAIEKVLEDATEAPKAIKEATEAPKAAEETAEAPKAIEEGTAAPKAIEEAIEAPKAIEEATEAPKAIEDATAAPKAIEEATAAPKAKKKKGIRKFFAASGRS